MELRFVSFLLDDRRIFFNNFAVDKVIILISAGSDSGPLSVVKQTISAGKQLAGQVWIIAFGLDIGQQPCS